MVKTVFVKNNNHYYSLELKQEIINEVLLNHRSQMDVSLDYALPSKGMLSKCIAQFKKNGYTLVEKTRGRRNTMGRKKEKTWDEMTEIERLQE